MYRLDVHQCYNRSRAIALARRNHFERDAPEIHHHDTESFDMASFHIKRITQSTFNDALSRYTAAVPEKLHDLDALRYSTIPTATAKRKDDLHLTKDEVEKLVEWKL